MVKVEIKKQANDYQSLKMAGHANAADKGEDLVCAALSGILSGALNALYQFDKDAFTFKIEDNQVTIIVVKPNHDTNLLMAMLEKQLKTIADEYPKNVKIKEAV